MKSSGQLQRALGVFDAVMLGLGSIVGTGIFVSIGLAAGIAGPSVLLAIGLAALLATCNALSSAQLAACHPVSGGTYEYGYRFLKPWLGFTAGWMFLCAKSASAATAALGFAGYLLYLLGSPSERWLVPLAAAGVLALTLLVMAGARRSSRANIVIVSTTLLALLVLVLASLPALTRAGFSHLSPFFKSVQPGAFEGYQNLLHATALMFVAYTGYGRIATLGEEVIEPQKTIPRAIIWTLVLSATLYLSVALAAVGSVGIAPLSQAVGGRAAPLAEVAALLELPVVGWMVSLGAVTAMLGVLLNLLLGLSRVALAMARRGDLPLLLARLDDEEVTPYFAVASVGILITSLTLLASVKTAWSFSAFTVLIYYAITNLCALQLSAEERLFSRLFSWAGLAGCLSLAFFVERQFWLIGLALISLGLVWHAWRSGNGEAGG